MLKYGIDATYNSVIANGNFFFFFFCNNVVDENAWNDTHGFDFLGICIVLGWNQKKKKKTFL